MFICVALLLGVSAEEKAKEETKPVEASKKQDKRGLYDHDFGGHDFGGHDFGSSHTSFSSHDFGSHGHEIVHHEPEQHHHHHHHEPIVHEKTLTVIKKVPYPVPHEKIVHVPHVKEVQVPYEVKVPKPYPVVKHASSIALFNALEQSFLII